MAELDSLCASCTGQSSLGRGEINSSSHYCIILVDLFVHVIDYCMIMKGYTRQCEGLKDAFSMLTLTLPDLCA